MQLLVHGIGHHGVDKMEPRRSELQDMADEVLRLPELHSDTEAAYCNDIVSCIQHPVVQRPSLLRLKR